MAWYGEALAPGRPDRPREGADRARRRARDPVPVLHRRLDAGLAREGEQSRGDDRGRPRVVRDPGGGVARPRRPDAQRRLETLDVTPARAPSLAARRDPLASGAEQRRVLAALGGPSFDEKLAAAGLLPLRAVSLSVCRSTSASCATRPADTATWMRAPTASRRCRGRRLALPRRALALRRPDPRHHGGSAGTLRRCSASSSRGRRGSVATSSTDATCRCCCCRGRRTSARSSRRTGSR